MCYLHVLLSNMCAIPSWKDWQVHLSKLGRLGRALTTHLPVHLLFSLTINFSNQPIHRQDRLVLLLSFPSSRITRSSPETDGCSSGLPDHLHMYYMQRHVRNCSPPSPHLPLLERHQLSGPKEARVIHNRSIINRLPCPILPYRH